MKFLFDFFPVIVFFAAFKIYGIYIATAASIAAAVLQVGLFWLRFRRFERMHLFTLAILAVFGGLTLALRDDTFIKWKPTLVNWVFAVVMAASHFIGDKPALERMLGAQLPLPAAVWRRLNLSWVAFFFVLGVLNIYVAFYYGLDLSHETRQETWVNFKVFGLLGLTLLFTLAQGLMIAKYLPTDKDPG